MIKEKEVVFYPDKFNLMIPHTKTGLIPAVLLFVFSGATAQTTTFNQNSSRSNNFQRLSSTSDAWKFGFESGGSFGVNSNEKTLFRGNSIASKMSAQYNFGNMGLGLSAGFVPGAINDNAINNFIIERKYQQAQVDVTTGKPFNGFLLFGPSAKFGKRIEMAVGMQGGMFLSNPGAVSIGQLGAARPLYRFDAGSKNLFPGFAGNFNISYPIDNSVKFIITSDYLQSKSSIRLYDPQRGIDIPIEQNRNVKLLNVGIGITKTFGTSREAGSGMATGKKSIGQKEWEDVYVTRDMATGQASGKRVLPTVNKKEIAIDEPGVQRILSPRDIATGQASGKRVLPTVNKREIQMPRDIATGQASGRTYRPGRPVFGNRNNESCGPVTVKKTYPDGTIEEKTFACPDDASEFDRQTQQSSFGEKVQSGLAQTGNVLANGVSKQGIIHRDIAARNILVGKISWGGNNPSGIITNKSAAVSAVTNLGGGASTSAYARNGVATGAGAAAGAAYLTKGTIVNFYAREAGSGMATGKREIKSPRDIATGQASGKRIYEPIYTEENGFNYNEKLASVKSNPMYEDKGTEGKNPLYESQNKINTNGENDCDGIAGLNVYLIDITTGATVATTQTENCGDFWFANIPSGTYIVNITGSFVAKKGYDFYMAKKADIAGEILADNNYWSVDIATDTGSVETAKALIKTKTKSNQSNDRTGSLVWSPRSNRILNITIGDLDGDGEAEMLIGGALPGGAVISAACRPGDPIPGLDVRLRQSSNTMDEEFFTTNEYGEFEFTNLKEGNYTISTEMKFNIDDETIITVGQKKSDSISENNEVALRSSGIKQTMQTQVKWMAPGPMQTAINNSHSNIKNLLACVDELEQMLNADNGAAKTAINNSHSNIKNLRIAASELENAMDDMETMEKEAAISEVKNKMTAMNVQFLALQQSLNEAGKQYTTVSNVLKTKHDTVKNSIGNIR